MIKNLIIIAIILGVVVISQQPGARSLGQNTYSWIEKKAEPYTSKTTDWLQEKVYPAIGREVDSKTGTINQEIGSAIETQKEKISQTLAEKIKNYFSNIIDSIFFPNKTSQSSSLLDSLNSQNPTLSPEAQKCIEACQLPKIQ